MKDYVELLKEKFQEKVAKNSRYSLRAYASLLELDPSSLDKVMKRQRELPSKYSSSIAKKLKLNQSESEQFKKNILNKERVRKNRSTKTTSWEVIGSSDGEEKLIRDWEFYAVLNLVKVDGFEPTVSWVASRLGLTEERVEFVVGILFNLGHLVQASCGSWVRSTEYINTTTEVPSDVLKEAHRQELLLGIDKIYSEPVERRGLYSVTVPTDPNNISKLKNLSLEYIEKAMKIAEKGTPSEVYLICSQVLPLTRGNNENK
ncbi:MAG: TIGR02147 family protein [Bdellovibrionales bacterium]